MLGRQENSRLRTNAIAALGVSTLLEASRGNLAAAQDLADRAVQQKYGPIKEQIAAATANLELILNDPKTSLQDKNRAQAQLDIQNQKAYDLGIAEENTKQVYSIANSAASNAQNFTPTPQYPSVSLALSAIQKATTPQEAMQIAESTGLLVAPVQMTTTTTGGSTSTGGTGTTSTTSTSTYKFTPTQYNTGAATAGMSLDAFKALDGEVQNFYVNSKPLVTAFTEALASIRSGESDPENVKSNIDSMAIPDAVKEYLKAQVDTVVVSQPDKVTTGVWPRVVNGIKSFFGIQ
jgi:hypothetical protein